MEDAVTEAESLLHPINLSRDDEVIEERQNPEAAKQEGERAGFINHLISNFVTGEDADESKQKQGERETIPKGGKSEDQKGGGLLDHIISNLVTPLSPKTGNTTQGNGEAFNATSENKSGFRSEEEVDGGGGGGGGGLINNIVSNLFHHSEGEVRESKVGEENKAEKTEEGGSGGGSIIDNIVSHLPTTSLPRLPDDAAPTTDEATILIHIVQD